MTKPIYWYSNVTKGYRVLDTDKQFHSFATYKRMRGAFPDAERA